MHCVWATTERRPLIKPDFQQRLWPYLGGIARENKMKALVVGGVQDHVHVLLSIPSTLSVAKSVQLLKGIWNDFFRPSGAGMDLCLRCPSDELLGYFRSSLRDVHHTTMLLLDPQSYSPCRLVRAGKPALHYRALPRLGLDDFDLRMAGADLLLEPVAGFGFAVAQEHGAGRDLADEIEQFAAIGVGGQVEVLHFTAFGDFAGTAAHDEGSARPGSLESSAGRVSVGVTDEENGLALVADHAGGEVVGGGVFAHHAGREDKNASAGEAHLLQLSGFKNDQVERLSQLEVAVVAVGAVRLGRRFP